MADSDDSAGPNDHIRPKKRRAPRACDECRKRKVRCDSASMPDEICSGCLSLNIDCVHTFTTKKRGPKIGSTRKQHTQVQSLMSSILATPQSYAVPKDTNVVREMLVNLAAYARSLEKELDRVRAANFDPLEEGTLASSDGPSPLSTAPSPGQHDDGSDVDLADSIANRVKGIRLEQSYGRHLGRSSQYMLLHTALDLRDELNGESQTISVGQRRPEFWSVAHWHISRQPEEIPFVFPPDDLLCDLVALFFTNVHPYFPLLHRPTFERQLSERLYFSDRGFGAMVLAVCAHGARHSTDPRCLHDSTSSIHSLGWKYFTQIQLRTSFVEPPSLNEVQLHALMTSFLYTTPVSDSAWAVGSLGLRLAQEVGAHRKQPKNSVEGEQWKRAFWQLMCMDISMSISLGRPRATTEDDFDLEYPLECDDEYWENPDPDKAFVQPEGKLTYMSYWVHFVKLMTIAGAVKRAIYTVRRAELCGDAVTGSGLDITDKVVSDLASALNRWFDSIPHHLKWDPQKEDIVFHHQSINLYAAFYWLQILVHRPFIRHGTTSNSGYPSLAICANAARSYVHMLSLHHQRTETIMTSHLMAPLFSCGIILLINLWNGIRTKSSTNSSREMGDVYKCLQFMTMYEVKYETAGRLRDVLDAVISVSQLPPLPIQPSLKRTRGLEKMESRGRNSQASVVNEVESRRQIAGSQRVSQRQSSLQRAPTNQNIPAGPTVYSPYIPAFASSQSVYSGAETLPNVDLYSANYVVDMAQHGAGDSVPVDLHVSPAVPGTSEHYSSFPGLEDLEVAPLPPWLVYSESDPSNQDDWNSFMENVDQMLHAINTQSFVRPTFVSY